MDEMKFDWLRQVFRWTLTGIRLALVFLVLFFLWTAIFWKTASIVLWCVFIIAVLALPRGKSVNWRHAHNTLIGILVVCTLAFGLVFWRVPLTEIGVRMEGLHRTADSGDPADYSTTDRIAIWSGNIAMGLVGAIPFPEVAWETIRMALPGPETHVIRSDFAMRSGKVRRVLDRFVRSLPEKKGDPQAMQDTNITWNSWDYTTWGFTEARVALAVNCPFVLRATATWENYRWRIDSEGSCKVSYGRFNEMTTVFRHPFDSRNEHPLAISETMFWGLQKVGWMYPFTVTYRWKFYNDDPRIVENSSNENKGFSFIQRLADLVYP